MLKTEQLLVKNHGNHVEVWIDTATVVSACAAFLVADEREPLGYQLRFCRISKPKRGGRRRRITLHYRRRFETPHPIKDELAEWDEETRAIQRVAASGSELKEMF